MALKEALLAVALGLPAPWYKPGKNPEVTEQYRTRVEVMAEAIARETESAKSWPYGYEALAVATLVLWHAESALSFDVHANTGSDPWGQDFGKARCLGQLHASGLVPKTEWETLAGTDLEATRRCAGATMRVLRASYWTCVRRSGGGDAVARMFEMYATGRSCEPSARSRSRAKNYHREFERFRTQQRDATPENATVSEQTNAS